MLLAAEALVEATAEAALAEALALTLAALLARLPITVAGDVARGCLALLLIVLGVVPDLISTFSTGYHTRLTISAMRTYWVPYQTYAS